MVISNQELIEWDVRWARFKADSAHDVELSSNVRLANSKAGIKPTAPLSVFDKENLIEFPLDSIHYLYMKSNPNSSFCPTLPYESISSCASINKKIK